MKTGPKGTPGAGTSLAPISFICDVQRSIRMMADEPPPAPPAGGAPPPPAGDPPPAPPAGGAPPPPAPAPVVAPWDGNEGVYKFGEGDKAQPWWNTIKEEPVRELMNTKAYKNPAELAMAYHNLNKLQNNAGDVVEMPKADAPKEKWDAFYAKLGRPETADKYDFKPAEGVQHDPNTVKFGKELFYELGVPAAKAGEAVQKWDKFVQGQLAAQASAAQQQNEQQITALETKWGPDLEKNKAAGQRVVAALGLSNDVITGVEKNIGSAAIVELLALIGRKSDEGKLLGGGTPPDPNDPSSMSKEAINAKITELQGNAEFQAKYTDAKHPEHKAAVEQMTRLFAAQK